MNENEKIYIPAPIVSLVEDMKKANPDAKLTYMMRLEKIRNYINDALNDIFPRKKK